MKGCSPEHKIPVLFDLSAGQLGHAELQTSPGKKPLQNCFALLEVKRDRVLDPVYEMEINGQEE